MEKWILNKIKGDKVIWGIIIILSILSTLAVYSSVSSLAYRQMQGNTEYYLIKHSFLILISIFVIWIFHKIDYRYYIGMSKLGLWISVPLLLFAWKHGSSINEASRWITIPLINKTFQPSDLSQVALISYLAYLLAKKQNEMQNFKKTFLPMLLWTILISGLIAMTNLSTAILIFSISLMLMFIGGVPFKFLANTVLAGVFVATIALGIGQRGKTALSRINNYLKGNIPYQTQQSYIAIASGGLYGKGPGKSTQRNFLPHPYSDFIYSILIEEYGLLGGALVLILYLILLYRCIIIVNFAKNIFGSLMTIGLSLLLVLQAFMNMAVAVGLTPVTGLTLPFISMGGTSLLFTGVTIGAILSVSRGEIDFSLTDPKGKKNKFKKNHKHNSPFSS